MSLSTLKTRNWKAGKLVIYAIAGVTVAFVVYFLGTQIVNNIVSLESWIASMGPWAFLIAIGLYCALAPAFVPDTLLGVLAGAAFGFIQGLAIVIAGSIIAVTIEFYLSRRLLKPLIDRKLSTRPSLQAIQRAVISQQLKLQFLIRLTPLNRAIASYVLGAAGVRYPLFLLACVGAIPHLAIEVYFGYASKHLAKVAGESHHEIVLHDLVIAAGLAVGVLVTYLISEAARKAVNNATLTTES